MIYVASGEKFRGDRNASHWLDHKHPSFISRGFSYNTKWDTAAVCIIMDEEAIRKATVMVEAPLEWWFTSHLH